MVKSIFVNLFISDIPATKTFWESLGFNFNPQFSDGETTLCLEIGLNIYAMLMNKERFEGFSLKAIPDTTKTCQVLLALQVESKAEVDEIMGKVEPAGGKKYGPVIDQEYMYGHSFIDLDGHQWELGWFSFPEA